MTLQLKLLIDYYAGTLLHMVLRPPTMLLGKLLRRNHNLKDCSSVTFLKMLGGGSLVIAYPALLGLKRAQHIRRLSIVTTPAVEPFARVLGIFDEIIVIRDDSPYALLLDSVKAVSRLFRSEALADFEIHSRLSTVFSVLTCARNRVGFYTSESFWRRDLSTHLLFCNLSNGVYEFYDQVAHLFGAAIPGMEECTRSFREALDLTGTYRSGIDRSGIGLAPTCSALRKERMLRPSEWVEIVKRKRLQYASRGEIEIHLFGGAFDRPALLELAGFLRAGIAGLTIINHAGELPLADSLRRIARLQELLCVDSALLHFARLMGTPTTSYWGPTDPRTLLRPNESGADEIHYEKITCSPCVHLTRTAPCNGNNLCMRLACNPQAEVDRNPIWPARVI
jgi:ADP-heptose:LPS heptosyltransferase